MSADNRGDEAWVLVNEADGAPPQPPVVFAGSACEAHGVRARAVAKPLDSQPQSALPLFGNESLNGLRDGTSAQSRNGVESAPIADAAPLEDFAEKPPNLAVKGWGAGPQQLSRLEQQQWPQQWPPLVLDVAENKRSKGARALVFPAHGRENQGFLFDAVGKLIPASQPSLCLDVLGGGSIEGSHLIFWTIKEEGFVGNQRFTFDESDGLLVPAHAPNLAVGAPAILLVDSAESSCASSQTDGRASANGNGEVLFTKGIPLELVSRVSPAVLRWEWRAPPSRLEPAPPAPARPALVRRLSSSTAALAAQTVGALLP